MLPPGSPYANPLIQQYSSPSVSIGNFPVIYKTQWLDPILREKTSPPTNSSIEESNSANWPSQQFTAQQPTSKTPAIQLCSASLLNGPTQLLAHLSRILLNAEDSSWPLGMFTTFPKRRKAKKLLGIQIPIPWDLEEIAWYSIRQVIVRVATNQF